MILDNPKSDVERVAHRYREAILNADTWLACAQAQANAHHSLLIGQALADRDRDFQALGLNRSGTGPA